MSESCLPDQFAPFKFARQGRRLQGQLALKDMNRITESLADNQATINVDLAFNVDDQQVSIMQGHLQVNVSMICQRCMTPMQVSVEANVLVGFVTDEEQALNLPDQYEPCIVQTETVSLLDIVEDELILALPIIALHEDQGCEPLLIQQQEEFASVVATEKQEKKNPFAVLSDLKRH